MRFKCMRVVAFIGMAGLAAMAQTGTAERANPPQFTSDQDFLKQAAELEHYSEIVEGWAKDHGSTPVRTAARQILYEQSVMAKQRSVAEPFERKPLRGLSFGESSHNCGTRRGQRGTHARS